MASRQFYPELQSARGVAAITVLIAHSLIFFESPDWFRKLSLITNAHAAVVTFFVLSGFVLSNALQGVGLNPAKVVAFYLRRLFRIYPGLWASSLIALGYVALVHYNVSLPHESDWFQRRFLPERFSALPIAASFAGVYPFLLPPLWTIYIELLASVAMPFLALAAFAERMTIKVGAGVALLALSFATPQNWPPAIFGIYLIDFYIGALIFAGAASVSKWVARLGKAERPLLYLCIALMALIQFAPVRLDYHHPTKNLVDAILAAVVVAIFAFGSRKLQWASKPRWVALGDVSYSIYLVHFPVMCFVGTAIGLAGFAFNGPLWNIGLAVGTLMVTLPLSFLLYERVEKPGIALGKAALRRLQLSRGQTG
jgi:peptidoglycan/LPS O-acetylase OafA/YrhL